MKTPLNTLLLLLLLLGACSRTAEKETEERADKIQVAACEAAPPPVIETVKFAEPNIKDDAVEEETVGYGSNSGEGAALNFGINKDEGSGDGNPASTTTTQKVDKKKIIKDGSLGIKTNDIVRAKKGFDALLKKLNAYYETEDFEKEDYRMSFSLKIRVPSANFEKLISEIENGKDEIVTKNINARDVTEEYTDVEARLNNKREYLKKYKEILARAVTIKDILEVQEIIRNLQEEIESREGHLKYLNDQVTYSTLDVSLFKDIAYVYKPQEQDSFRERVKNSLSNGWMAIVDFVLWFIKIWPQLLVVLAVIILGRRWYKKRKANK